MERLKLLLVLTVCDIRAVGPGVWNGWKGQLLRTLYYETEPMLDRRARQAGPQRTPGGGRAPRLAGASPTGPPRTANAYLDLHYPAYWLRVDEERQLRHAEFVRERRPRRAELHLRGPARWSSRARPRSPSSPPTTRASSPSSPAPAPPASANIVDAQIFTTTDGRALDTLIVSPRFRRRTRTRCAAARASPRSIEQALRGGVRVDRAACPQAPQEPAARRLHRRARGDRSTTSCPTASPSSRSNASTAPAFSTISPRSISDLNLDIASAHIATFGERVVDTFYVTDLVGHKIAAKAAPDAASAARSSLRSAVTKQPAEAKACVTSSVRQFVNVGGAT